VTGRGRGDDGEVLICGADCADVCCLRFCAFRLSGLCILRRPHLCGHIYTGRANTVLRKAWQEYVDDTVSVNYGVFRGSTIMAQM